MSNEGKILTSTLWSQSGNIYVSVNGEQTRLSTVYNKFCPFVNGSSGARSVTGCSNTAHSQIIYYWIEQGYRFDLSISSSDYFFLKPDESTRRYCSTTSLFGEGTITEINALLQNTSPEYRIANGDFIAALNYYCAVKNHSKYGSSTGTGSARTEIYLVSGFDSARARYRSSDHYNPETERFYSTYDFSDVGYSVIRENLDYGEVVQIGISGHAIYLDGYRFNSSTGEYEYHLNYGWGIWSSSTKWYTVQGLQEIYKDTPNKAQGILNIVYDISPDAKVIVSNSRSEYYGGSFLRGMERINHIKTTKSTTFTFADDIAGDTISLSATAAVTSKVDLEFKNFNVTLSVTATTALSSAYAMSFDFDDGAIIVNNNSATKYAIQNTGSKKLTVELDSSYLYSGYCSGGISAIQQVMEKDYGYVYNSISSSFCASVSGYAIYASAANDEVTLRNSSAIFGNINLGAGKNVLSIENGSLFYGDYTGSGNTLAVNLHINSNDTATMIALKNSTYQNSFANACSNTLNVTVTGNAITGTYTLLTGMTFDYLKNFTVNLTAFGKNHALNYNNSSAGDFSLVYDSSTLSLTYEPPVPELRSITASDTGFTNGNVWLDAKYSSSAYETYYSTDGVFWVYAPGSVEITENTTVYFKAKNRGGVYSEISTYEVDNIDKDAPEITVSGNAENWVNEDIVLTISATDVLSGVSQLQYSFDNREWLTGNTVTMSQNGELYFKAQDQAGNETSSKIVVDKIDKTAPELTICGVPAALTNQDVTLTASSSDSASGIKNTQYSLDNANWIDGDTITLTENGDVYFRTIDFAGNVTSEKVTIYQIDKTAPDAPAVSLNTNEMTNLNVIVTVTAAADAVRTEYSLDSGATWQEYISPVEITENVNFSTRSFDGAGNISANAGVAITNIDKTVPETPQISADIKTPTQENVLISALFAADSVKNEYSTDGETWQIYTAPVEMTENGKISFRSTDKAGNISDIAEYTVTNIDRCQPDVPELSNTAEKLASRFVLILDAGENTIEYSFDQEKFSVYSTPVILYQNCDVYYRAVDEAGNHSDIVNFSIDCIDWVSDRFDLDHAFVSKKYSYQTSLKVRDSHSLFFGENAFNSIDSVSPECDILVLVDPQNTLSAPIPENLKTVAGRAVKDKSSLRKSSYSYNVSSTQYGNLTIDGNMGNTEFIRFSTVNVTENGTVNAVRSAKETLSLTTTEKLVKGIFNESDTWKYSLGVGGKFSAKEGKIDLVENFSSVAVTDSVAGKLANRTISSSATEQKKTAYRYTDIKEKKKITFNGAGSLTAKNSEIGEISGFSTIKLYDCQTGDVIRLSESGKAFSVITEEFTALQKNGITTIRGTQTVKYSRNGTLTANNTTLCDIVNVNTVTLDNSSADAISNIRFSQQKFGYELAYDHTDTLYDFDPEQLELISQTEKLSGSVTLKNHSSADSIENFSSAVLYQSSVDTIANVQKVTVYKEFNTIGCYTGTTGNDTLTIAKNAVLHLAEVDFSAGGRDRIANNGSLILTDAIDIAAMKEAKTYTGKGEIAATTDVYEALSDTYGVLDLGATAEGFRTRKYELADNAGYKKAAKWDLKSDYTGWLGGTDCDVADDVDYIRFTVSKKAAGMDIEFSGTADYILLNNKGHEIGNDLSDLAAGTYILQLNRQDSDSASYTLALA